MADTAPELKPCPFCGGEANTYETQNDGEYCVQTQCKGCGAEIAFWLPWTADAGQRAVAWGDVERRWNIRTDLARAEVDALVAAKDAEIARYRAALLQFENCHDWPIFSHNIVAKRARAALTGEKGNGK